MCKTTFALFGALFLGSSVAAPAQNRPAAPASAAQPGTSAAETEIRQFFDAYADDLRQQKREALVGRYDPRGHFQVGNGHKRFVLPAENRHTYLTLWSGPRAFTWKELTVDVPAPTVAVVTALFDWQSASGETRTYSYSAVLVKNSGEWKIRVEDESESPQTFTTQLLAGKPSAAGAFRYEVKARAGSFMPAHRHTAEQRVTVRSGRKFILLGDLEKAQAQRVEAGSSVVIPAGVWHIEWWESETVEEVEGTGPMRTEQASPASPRVP